MQTVKVTLRSDYLEDVLLYALEQVKSSGGEINPLTDCSDAATVLQDMIKAVTYARGVGHSELMLLPLPSYYKPVEAYDVTKLR
mgnify:CR=1 FL=1